MIKKTNFKGIRGPQIQKVALLALLLLQGTQAFAEVPAVKGSDGTSVLEILGYVAMIIGVILLAWIIGAAQSKNSSKPSAAGPTPTRTHRHFDHPNDPHFRKLRKKTS